MTEASEHCRRRGSCQSRRPSTRSRVTQIGSWWLTATASWPRARVAGGGQRGEHPHGACSTYGSPHDGRNGLRRCRQCRGSAQRAVADAEGQALEDVARPRSAGRRCAIGSPSAAAIGPRRLPGPAPAARRPRRRGPRRPAPRRPARPSPGRARRGGSRAAGRRAPRSGLCTSPWRSRCTTVVVASSRSLLGSRRVAAAAARAACGSAVGDPVERRRRRGRRRRTRSRTPRAAGRRRGSSIAWKNAV